jgi:hypothetical protein
MPKAPIQIVALALSALVVACDSHVQGTFKNELIGPSGAAAIVSFAPPTLALSPVGSFACPATAPFLTSFDLIVDGRATGDLFLDAVGFRFIDGSSIGRTPLFSSFSAPELNARFGQTLIAAGTRRAFGFAPQFGCDQFRPVTVTAEVTLRDRTGAQQQMSISSPIR